MRKRFLLMSLLLPVMASAQYVGQHEGDVKVSTKIAVKAYSFDLQDVRLLDSRFKQIWTVKGSGCSPYQLSAYYTAFM